MDLRKLLISKHSLKSKCCSKCKKSKKRDKSCLCIVPASQRRIPLNKDGCSSCKCQGCSKEDVQLDYGFYEILPIFTHLTNRKKKSRRS